MNISELLPTLEFCAELTQSECAILASLGSLESFPPKSIVFRTGEPAVASYLVVEGHVSLEICAAGVGCRRILSVGRGELIGWSPFLSDACFTATARTLEPTQLIRIDADRLRQACEQNHEFGYQILRKLVKTLSTRINAARLQMLDVFGTESVPSFSACDSRCEASTEKTSSETPTITKTEGVNKNGG